MWSTISQTLITQLIQKDSHAFWEFYLQTVDIFYRFVKAQYRIDEDDIQQLLSTYYIKIRDHLSDYNPSYKFETRYWSIFRNLLKDRFKKTKEYHFSDLDSNTQTDRSREWFADHLQSDEEDILTILDRQFTYDHIIDAMTQMEKEYTEILHLKYVELKSNEEIAVLCSISPENVRQRISRWLKKIKQLLWWE